MSEITIEPTGHYVLVEMVEIAKQSKGGIIFANVEKEQAATQVAKVIAIGPTVCHGFPGCIPSEYPPSNPRYSMEPHQIWGIEEGSFVYYPRYEGDVIKIAGYENFRLVNDERLKGVLKGNFELTKADF